MRSIFAFLLGAAVTVGGAYTYDRMNADSAGAAVKPMVNWDVVAQSARIAANSAQAQWNRLTAK